MGGKETLHELLKIDPGVKAIVSSGYANDPIIFHYEDEGFKAAMAKPYKIEELVVNLKKVMG